MTKPPASVPELISLWPSAEVFSDELGLKYRSHGRLMKLRGSIPRKRWDAVVLSASRLGIDGVNHRALEAMHAKAPEPKPPAASSDLPQTVSPAGV